MGYEEEYKLPECEEDNVKPKLTSEDINDLMKELYNNELTEENLEEFVEKKLNEEDSDIHKNFKELLERERAKTEENIEKTYTQKKMQMEEELGNVEDQLQKIENEKNEKMEEMEEQKNSYILKNLMNSVSIFYKKIEDFAEKIGKEYNEETLDYMKEKLKESYEQNKDFRKKINKKMGYSSKFKSLFSKESKEKARDDAIKKYLEEEREKTEREYMKKMENLEEMYENEMEKEKRKKEEIEEMKDNLEYEKEEIKNQEKAEKVEELKNEVLKELKNDLEEAGYIKTNEYGEIEETEDLMDVVSKKIFEEVFKEAFGTSYNSSRYGIIGKEYDGTGEIKDDEEIARLHPVKTLLKARMRHPDSKKLEREDMVVKKYRNKSTPYVVLTIDISGSMEGCKLDAAKKTAFAINGALKEVDPNGEISYIVYDRNTMVLDNLKELKRISALGGTDIGYALEKSREVVEKSGKDSGIIYLITDGYPEYSRREPLDPYEYAYEEGEKIGNNEIKLRTVLIDDSPESEDFCKNLTRVSKGKFIVADPQNLAKSLIGDFWREVV